jgi:exopolysaccharide biosynthesis polyprenyl glycosylphosphotransferase
MATSDFWQRVSASVSSSLERAGGFEGSAPRAVRGTTKLWMLMDAVTVVAAAMAATLYRLHDNLPDASRRFWHGTLIPGGTAGILLALLCGFIATLILTSRRLQLYSSTRLNGILHEQRLSMQACFTSSLLLMGALYLSHTGYISRAIVMLTLITVTVVLSARRFLCRVLLYRRYERGMDTRNVLIVGTGPEAHALRHHLESMRHLGYRFKGFIDSYAPEHRAPAGMCDVVGNLETLFLQVRKLFVDEIFFTTPCERGVVHNVLDQARTFGVDLRVIPDMYDGLAWSNPIEYIGQFPTIPLHCGQIHEVGLVLKRSFDILFSTLVLLLLSPVLLAVAIAIKLDSPGPVFYKSERIGKKGRVFRCLKFRTMVIDAEQRRAEVLHMNERDGVLFKVANDPRVTRLGRLLRKYSLDELPQFFNVFHGDMSVVGPRPPIASEVKEYKLNHLRRLNVMPGITGLWQVQGRKDPSFDSYVSLDMTYIDNWSIWLDLTIILRTVGVMLAGTGS